MRTIPCKGWAARPISKPLKASSPVGLQEFACARRNKLPDALRGWIACGLIQSAHDCSEGGLAVALSECCLSQERGRGAPKMLGAQVETRPQRRRPGRKAMLFGETQSRILVSVGKPFLPKVLGQAAILGIPAARIGVVGGRLLRIRYGESDYSWPLDDLRDAWWTAIRRPDGIPTANETKHKNVKNHPKHYCGVFGIYGHPQAARVGLLRTLRPTTPRSGKRRNRFLQRQSVFRPAGHGLGFSSFQTRKPSQPPRRQSPRPHKILPQPDPPPRATNNRSSSTATAAKSPSPTMET